MHLGAGGAKYSFLTPWTLLFAWGTSKEALIFWASSWNLFIPGIPTSSHHQLGVWTQHPLHTINFLYSFAGGSCKRSLPSPSFWMVASSCRECSMSGPSFSEGPRSRSVEGCPAAWSSSDIDSRSWKVIHQCDPVGLCIWDWAWPPASSGALWHLWLCLQDLLLGWSQLWEWWQMSGLILVVDQLSLSIHSSNMEAAASACRWASLASASSQSPEVSCLSLWEVLSQWQDGWVPPGSSSLLPFNWSFSSARGSPSRKTKCPWLPPVLVWTHTVGVEATSLACIPDGTGPQFLLWRSGTLRAGWQVHLPQGPALGDHAGNHGKSTSLLPSAKIQSHVQTSFEGWRDGAVLWHPTGGIYPGITLHLGNVPPPGWTALLSCPLLSGQGFMPFVNIIQLY